MEREGSLHHAYLVLGEPSSAKAWIFSLLEKLGVSTTGNPDLFLFEEGLFGVDDARALAARSIEKAFTGRKIFLLLPNKITFEAQNALLKTFEEPAALTHFFLVVREEALVLPTLRSRMSLLRAPHAEADSAALRFLAMPVAKRLAFAKKFADDGENLPAFLDSLLAARQAEAFTNSQGLDLARRIYGVRRYASDRSASARLILEHLALVV